MGNATKNWDELNISIAKKLSVINQIKALNKLYGANIGAPIPTYKCNFTQLLDRPQGDLGHWGLLVRTNGMTSCCQFLYDYPIGNIFYQSIEDMFLGDVFSRFIHIARKRREHYNSKACNGCLIKTTCGYGCLGLSIENGDANNLDGSCHFRQMYAIFKECNFIY